MSEKNDEQLCKFAYYNGFAIGAICTRIEAIPDWYVRNSYVVEREERVFVCVSIVDCSLYVSCFLI